MLRVVHNFNADLIQNMQDEGLLPEEPVVDECVGEGDSKVCFSIYEGQKHWFIRVLPFEGSEEVIVPKDISYSTALDVAKQLVLGAMCDYEKDSCENDFEVCQWDCKQEYNSCLESYDPQVCKQELEECLKDCESDFNNCMSIVEENYCKPFREANKSLMRLGLRPLGCISGVEEGSEDIDEICYFGQF